MSGTVRTGIVFGIAAVVAFIAGFMFPLPPLNFLLAFGSMLALGWGAGYTAAKIAEPGTGRGIGRGATAGLIAGAVVLALSTLLFGLLATPAARQALAEMVQPDAQVVDPSGAESVSADFVIATFVGGSGAGFCLGLVNLILLAVGGAIGGLSWRGIPSSAPQSERSVRVYDQRDS